MSGNTLARIELSAEVRDIESLIDSGDQDVASFKLQAAHTLLGRRPEYRYLVCLYESTFRVRSDRDLLRELIELVGEQPDLMEATVLLAKLYARTGDAARADLFARLALESPTPSVRARATEVLKGPANDGDGPPSSHVQEIDRRPPKQEPPASTRLKAAPIVVPSPSLAPAVPAASAGASSVLDAWFVRARRELVHHRTPMYGVRAVESVAAALLEWGRTVAAGGSFISPAPLPLTRASLAEVDDAMLALRRQHGARGASKTDNSPAMAAAGFFLAVVLHELEANVFEIAADDGACKVVLPSGAGTRPILVASAFAEGTGPSFTQTFDRLAAARDLASFPPAGESPHVRRASSGQMVAARPVSLTPRPSSSAPSVLRDELALTRPDVEASPLRLLERPMRAADAPLLNLAGIASGLATSPLGQDIAERTGIFLAPTPPSVEALDSYCLATRGDAGAAPERNVWQPLDVDEELILIWGAFLGEALIAAFGGVWECDPNAPSDPRLFRVVCEDRVAAWPMAQVYLRLKNGARYNLIDFVANIGKLLA